VHLDIKPENLFLSKNGTYKIGDLGLTTFNEFADVQERTFSSGDLSEGDSRYLCREMLEEKYGALSKADIFALGLSAYELARGPDHPLPSMGDEWRDIRDGILPPLPCLSPPLNELLHQMTAADPAQRPSARDLIRHPLLLSRKRTHPMDDEFQAEFRAYEMRIAKLENFLRAKGHDPESLNFADEELGSDHDTPPSNDAETEVGGSSVKGGDVDVARSSTSLLVGNPTIVGFQPEAA